MDYSPCYIFQPSTGKEETNCEPQGLHSSWPTRMKLFEEAWAKLDTTFTEAIANVNTKIRESLQEFLDTDSTSDRLACGIILSEPGSSSSLVPETDDAVRIVSLDPTACPNLKGALKAINRHFSLESYDLLPLSEHVHTNQLRSVVVHIQDTEGCAEVLSSLIMQLHSWRDRIPFTLLLSISTSVSLLEQQLTSAARKKVQCTLFQPATCRQEFEALLAVLRQGTHIMLGSRIIKLAVQRQDDYMHDTTCAKHEFKYSLMTSYFANPLTVFMSTDEIDQAHFDALRTTASFRNAMRQLLDANEVQRAKSLMTDNKLLRQHVQNCIEHAFRTMSQVQAEVDLNQLPFHEIYLSDISSSHVFRPRPRQAIERALTMPQDYLARDEVDMPCHDLYKLYKESGSLINAYDLWEAFSAQREGPTSQTLALFQRSLAEMKHLGIVKGTRKRVDHVGKAAWPGL